MYISNRNRSYENLQKWRKKLQKIILLLFIDSTALMASSLSNLVNDLLEEIYKIKCKCEHDKNVKIAELNVSIASVFLNT